MRALPIYELCRPRSDGLVGLALSHLRLTGGGQLSTNDPRQKGGFISG